jgi:hypothetical protein
MNLALEGRLFGWWGRMNLKRTILAVFFALVGLLRGRAFINMLITIPRREDWRAPETVKPSSATQNEAPTPNWLMICAGNPFPC